MDNRIGFSQKINDPAFAKYVKNTNSCSAIFKLILAVPSVSGYFIYGENSDEMKNPESLYF